MRSDLTDHYYNQLQELKTHHALEQEQLRAKLSDRHLQGFSLLFFCGEKIFHAYQFFDIPDNYLCISFAAEINKVHLEASHQVEVVNCPS